VKFCPFFKFFLGRHKLPFFGQNCSLPFSLRSLDSPALLKSRKKHYEWLNQSGIIQPRITHFKYSGTAHIVDIITQHLNDQTHFFKSFLQTIEEMRTSKTAAEITTVHMNVQPGKRLGAEFAPVFRS
jgi:hypothetical protein